jgi:phage terminase large subunit
MSNQDIINTMIANGIRKTDEVIADNAEPKSIHELFVAGFNIHPAVKGADSIRVGIEKVKGYRLKVTSRSRNLIVELKNYRWKMDKNGNSLNVPVDRFNHALDAVRYVILNKLFVRKKRMFGVRSFKI